MTIKYGMRVVLMYIDTNLPLACILKGICIFLEGIEIIFVLIYEYGI